LYIKKDFKKGISNKNTVSLKRLWWKNVQILELPLVSKFHLGMTAAKLRKAGRFADLNE
jgi:hypothetical protein